MPLVTAVVLPLKDVCLYDRAERFSADMLQAFKGTFRASLPFACSHHSSDLPYSLPCLTLYDQNPSIIRQSWLNKLPDLEPCMQDGMFMLAFSEPRGAIEWALLLQLALLK